jgi:hypothetical protein
MKSNQKSSIGQFIVDSVLEGLFGDENHEGSFYNAIQEELSITPIQRRIERIVTNGLGYLDENTSPSNYLPHYFDRSGKLKKVYDSPEQLNNHLEDMESRVRGKGPITVNHNVSNLMFHTLCDLRDGLVN